MLSKKYWLIAILILGFVLRVYKLDANSLYGDELTLTLDSYSILKTGKDQTGLFLPLTFPMRVGSPPGYVYFSIPFVLLFGPTALGIRALSVVSGVGSIFLIYLISKKLFSDRYGLASAFLMAISPWGINLSRGGFETNLALFLTLLGVELALYSSRRPWYLILGALSFGLAVFSYQSYKLLVPLIVLLIVWYKGRKYFLSGAIKKYSVAAAIVLGIFSLVLFGQIFLKGSETRFVQTQNDLTEKITQKVNLDRSVATDGGFASVFHNKFSEYFINLKNAYFGYFSSEFLFLNGDKNPRHNMTQTGAMYLADIILVLTFFTLMIKKKPNKEYKLLFAWILISPAAASITGDVHALRNSLMLPGLIMISGRGLVYLIKHQNIFLAKVILTLFIVVLVVQFLFLTEKVFFVSPNKFTKFWSGDALTAVKITQDRKGDYDQIILSRGIDNIEYAYPVYTAINPQEVIDQKELLTKRYGSVLIADLKDVQGTSGRTLIIAGNQDSKLLGTSQEIIRSANFEPALYLYSTNQ